MPPAARSSGLKKQPRNGARSIFFAAILPDGTGKRNGIFEACRMRGRSGVECRAERAAAGMRGASASGEVGTRDARRFEMPIGASLLPEFDQEMASTRRVLERVPAERLAWRPHTKSLTMGGLATHVATLPSWASYAMGQDSLDLAPGGKPIPRAEEAKSAGELVARFDAHVAAARAAIAGAADAAFDQPWTLLVNGQTIFSLPRGAVLRTTVMNHLIHHRAQLGVYFRLCDVPVPSIYGPSADEGNT